VNKENEDDKDKELLIAVISILKSWCDHCFYKQSKKGQQQQPNPNEFQEDTEDPNPDFVYFIKMKRFVKIGQSKSPIKRYEQISRNAPFKTKLLHYTALVDEPTVHKRFQGNRKSNEWFHLTYELGAYITALIKKDRELDLKRDLELESKTKADADVEL
jgi:hypothetical protein